MTAPTAFSDSRRSIAEARIKLFLLDSKRPRNDPHVLWEVFVNWCMDGKIYSKSKPEDENSSGVALRAERDLLFASYLYGAEKNDTDFQDAIINAIIQQSSQHPFVILDEDHIAWVYNNTAKGDMLRVVFLTIAMLRAPLSVLERQLQSAKSEEFRNELLKNALQMDDKEREDIYQADLDPLLEVELRGDDTTRKVGEMQPVMDCVRMKRGWRKLHPWVVDLCQFHLHGEGGCPLGLLQPT